MEYGRQFASPSRRRLPLLRISVIALAALAAITSVAITMRNVTLHAALGAPAKVSATWLPTRARTSWPAVSGAASYKASLIRLRDKAIVAQKTVHDTSADMQPLYPGEQYAVAVQAIDSGGVLGAAALSDAGQADNATVAGLNGFYDGEDVAMGAIDNDRWDVQVWRSASAGGAFVNDQLHYHLAANSPTGSQAVTTARARVPVDLANNRTAHVHGEVDLKSDMTQWFGFALSPHPLGTDEPADLSDRPAPATMPVLELFDGFDGRVHLLQGLGNGDTSYGSAHDLGSIPNPTNVNNVRDVVDLYVNQNHVKVLINGQAAFDTNLAQPLGMPDHAWLTLFAESYPESGGGGKFTACDQPGKDCNIWHLDSWGFDAPAGVTDPTVRVSYEDGCAAQATPDMMANVFPSINDCGGVDLRYADSSSSPKAVNVNVSSVAGTQSAGLVLRAGGVNPSGGSLKARVNGGPWIEPEYLTTRNWTDATYRFPLPAGALQAGANKVEFLGGGWNSPQLLDVQVEQILTTAHAAPALPPQAAPLGTWTGATPGGTGGGTPPPTATPPPTGGGSVQLNGTPCMITVNGQMVNGTCTGTFIPAK